MTDTAEFDRQLGAAVAYVSTLLRNGSSVAQAIKVLAQDASPPLNQGFRRVAEDLDTGTDLDTAMADLQRRVPSVYLGTLIGILNLQHLSGSDLADALDPVGAAIRERAGSAGANETQLVKLQELAGPDFDRRPFESAAPRGWGQWGPLNEILEDPEVSEILIDGPYKIYVERRGKLVDVDAHYLNDTELYNVIQDIIAPLGQVLNESNPMVDSRFADGSRMTAVIRPISLIGPVVTIRKFRKEELTLDDLLRFECLTPDMATFIQACVQGRLNILISGGTGSGKTTVANIVAGMINPEERIITIEQVTELKLKGKRVIPLEARPPNVEGRGEVSVADLVHQALKMRPERIIVGELRGGEVLHLLGAMNTGHDGSMATLHANSPRDAIMRMEVMFAMAEPSIPVLSVREHIASAINLIIQQDRLADGRRKISMITEVTGMENGVVEMRDIFVYEQEGHNPDGTIRGSFKTTGVRPRFLSRLEQRKNPLPPEMFQPPSESAPAASGAIDSSAFDRQLGDTLLLMGALLRSGYSFLQTLEQLAQDLPDPIGSGLTTVIQRVGRGESFEEALDGLREWSNSASMGIVIEAIQQQRREGGNLAERLEALAGGVRAQAGDNPAMQAPARSICERIGLKWRREA